MRYNIDIIWKIIIVIFVAISLFSIYTYIDNLIIKNLFSKNSVKEGLTTQEDIVKCNQLNTLTCGTDNNYTPILGTCEDTYGPDSDNHDPFKMQFCVDEIAPSLKTPTANLSKAIINSSCSKLAHTYARLQIEFTNIDKDGKPCNKTG